MGHIYIAGGKQADSNYLCGVTMSKRDAEQVQKVLSGDQAAYEPLVEAYQGRIFAFVAGRIRNFSATEDIVQNAFVEAYMHL